MEVTARTATLDDHDELVRLASEGVADQTGKRGGELWARTARRAVDPAGSIHEDLADSAVRVLVGTIDEVPLGYGVARLEVLPDGGILAVVSDLYVDPEARGVGIGEALMNGLVGWARDEGCFGIDSQALPGDRHTKNFFESFGLVARSLIVHRSLA